VTRTPSRSDRDLINAFGASHKALVARRDWLLAHAEEEEETGELAQMEAEEKAKALKERAGQIELVLSRVADDD